MQSTTSLFNGTLYRKTMSRFWPAWAGYTLLLAFLLPLNLLRRYSELNADPDAGLLLLQTALDIPNMLGPIVLLLAVAGVLCAMGMFGYLYNSRSACMMHTLPFRRETLFTTQYLAGLSILCLPVVAMGVLTAVVEMALIPSAYWPNALPALGNWLVAVLAVSLFFFSMACFCAMFTGHILVLPIFYAIANFAIWVLYCLIHQLIQLCLYGFSNSFSFPSAVELMPPPFALSEAAHWDTILQDVPLPGHPGQTVSIPMQGHVQDMKLLLCYAVVGLLLAAAALLLYRSRRIESAGDVVAIPAIRPLFKIGVSLSVGLVFGILTATFFSLAYDLLPLSLFIVVWAVVGWFAAEMLLEKSFRVLKHWRGAAGMAAVIALLLSSLSFDLFGYERRVPQYEDVASINLSLDLGVPSDDAYGNLEISDPELIQRILALHQTIVDNREQYQLENGNEYHTHYINIAYTLKNGRTLLRSYHHLPLLPEDLEQENSLTWQYQQLLQNRALVEQAYNFDFYEKGKLNAVEIKNALSPVTQQIYVSYIVDHLSGQQRMDLWNAVRQDFDEGTIGIRYLFDTEERNQNTYVTDLCFHWDMNDPQAPYNQTITITLTPQASHTLALLEEYQVFAGGYELAPHSSDIDTEKIAFDTESVEPQAAAVNIPEGYSN